MFAIIVFIITMWIITKVAVGIIRVSRGQATAATYARDVRIDSATRIITVARHVERAASKYAK